MRDKQNNWVPLSKALVNKLPRLREYSEIEAMFSLTVDYDCSNSVSISGYASLWGWSRKRVSNFLKKYGVTIEYSDKFDRHKKGQVGYQVGDRKGTGKGQVEFIDSRWLRNARNRKGTGGEQEGNRKGSTTNNPNPNPNPKDITTDEQKAFASYLVKIASARRDTNLTPSQLLSWANTIRLMMDKDGRTSLQISNVLNWYEKNWMNDFVPVVSSAKSFREKWPKLLDAVDRAKKKTNGDTHNGFNQRDYQKDASSNEQISAFINN